MRLIDADALIEYIDVGHLRNPLELCFSERAVVDMLERRPTVDAVPVVRCKDCKHCLLDLSGREGHLCMYKRKSLLNARVKRDDFCSWGERENDGICKED